MSAMNALVASSLYPSEIIALLRYKFGSQDKTMYQDLSQVPSQDDPEYAYAMCYYFLNKTSRSFARVIQELDKELLHPICIFYLVLRGLDTIEDDMTLDLKRKTDLLHDFADIIYKAGWTFEENSLEEKDRPLMVQFDVVITEFLRLEPKYQEIIKDITKRMGDGMSEFRNGRQVSTLEDYNAYTHYVAGLVGIGLTRLFVVSGLESVQLETKLDLSNEMGLFLQKVNIMKDYLADIEDGRLFWPEAIWKLYVPENQGVESFADGKNLDRGLACLNHLCANALELVPSCLEYLSLLRNKSVFQFAAIPQLMAIASIDCFYNNPALFQKKGNKIRRGLTVKLIFQSKDMESLKQIYFDFAMSLSRKARAALGTNEHDKSFLPISLACANIVRWVHEHDQRVNRPRPLRSSSSNILEGSSLLFIIVAAFAIVIAVTYVPGMSQ